MSIIAGKKLMIFVKENDAYRSIGYATNHTFSTSATTVDISHKDLADTTEGAGKWSDLEVDTYSWTLTTENFYADDSNGLTFADLMNYYISGQVLEVKFGLAPNSETGAPTDGWSPKTSTQLLSGKVVISAIDVNASVSEKASYTATFTGKGPVSIGA